MPLESSEESEDNAAECDPHTEELMITDHTDDDVTLLLCDDVQGMILISAMIRNGLATVHVLVITYSVLYSMHFI